MTLENPGILGVPNRVLRDTVADPFKTRKIGKNWILKYLSQDKAPLIKSPVSFITLNLVNGLILLICV
jgi:hypothetical protein